MLRVCLILISVFLLAAVPDRARQANEAYEQGRYAEAEQAYREAITENPGDARLHFNLGNALAQQGKADEAIESYERFKQLNPDPDSRALADYNIGNLKAMQEQWDEAAKRYQSALRNNPDDEDAVHNFEYAKRQLQQPPPPQDQQQDQDDQQGGDMQPQPQQQRGQDDPDDQEGDDQQQGADGQPEDDDQPGDPSQPDMSDGQGDADAQDQPIPGQMTRDEAEQLLNALSNREQDLIRDFLKDLAEPGETTEKDW